MICAIDSFFFEVDNVSTGPVVPAVTPKDPATFDWKHAVLGFIITALSTWIAAQFNVKPPVIPPAPVPVINSVIPDKPIVEPLKPAPDPVPAVDPAVVVNPRPTPLVPEVKLADLSGKPLTNPVEPGHLFVATSGQGITLTTKPSNPDDADIIEQSPNKVLVVLRNECKLEIIVIGGERPFTYMVSCNHAPQPPPVDPVKPVVVDPVTPVVPVAVNPRVLILYGSKANNSKDQINGMDSPKVVAVLNEKCPGGMWHKWDSELDVSNQTAEWKTLKAACVSEIAKQSLNLPVLCIENGSNLKLVEITSESATLAALTSTLGG